MSSFQGRQFKQLQREWYDKLKDEGFEDIEATEDFLKFEIDPRTRDRAICDWRERYEYHVLAADFASTFRFDRSIHHHIWVCYAEGFSVRKTAERLSISRNQVWNPLKILIQKFKIRHMEQVKIRSSREGDREFLFSSWLKSYKNTSEFAKRIKNDVYFTWHHKIIEAIIQRPGTQVLVATLPDEEDVILGYLVFEAFNPVIHYCFVKKEWQKLGIAWSLIKAAKLEAPIFFTHWTHPVDSLINKKSIKLVYDPYRI